MKRLDKSQLTKMVDDILFDSVKSYNLAEKVIDAIREMDNDMIKFKNYKFICPACKEDTCIEEVRENVTRFSVIDSISLADDGSGMLEYGDIRTSGGAIATSFQCMVCRTSVPESTLIELANQNNDTDITPKGMIKVTISKTEYFHPIMVPADLTQKDITRYISMLIDDGKVPGFDKDTDWWIDQ